MKPFLALITPIGDTDAHPEHPIVLPPPGSGGPVDPGYGKPTPPDVIWGGRPPGGNWPGWGPPPAWWPGHPSHPIPPGIWPQPPQPPAGGGGDKPPGIWGGANEPFPTPPIANVPGAPGWKPPEIPPNPPVIWPGPGPLPNPDHPISKPPSEAPPGYDWYLEYLPLRGGWVWVLGPEKPAS